MKKIEVLTITTKYTENVGWISNAILSNRISGNNKSITGNIGVYYYCETLKESLDILLESLNEMNIDFSDHLDLVYQDEEQENPNNCPKEVLSIFEEERQKLIEIFALSN